MTRHLHVARVAAFASLLPLASCSKSLNELIPFPCASDKSCPAGLACIPGVGCSTAQLDSPCVPNETDCSTATQGAKCEQGICTLSCSGTLPCRAGHVCSADPSVGAGVCLPDCSDGQICPTGLSCAALPYSGKKGCVGGGGTVENKLDAPCAKDEDCGKEGTQLRCALGACSLPCDKGLPCAAGHVCSRAGEPGFCLVDCSTGTKCQPSLACHELWYEARRGCMAASEQVTACKSVLGSETTLCRELCGLSADKFRCSDNPSMLCPFNSTCDVAKNVCNCDTASTTPQTCAGAACDASNNYCKGTMWWCKPNRADQDCKSVNPNLEVVCSCVSGNLLLRACGYGVSCEDLCKEGCDFIGQNCRDEATPKCDPTGGAGRPACEPLLGQKQAGQTCQLGTNASFPAADDCDKGHKCSFDTSPSVSSGVCRKLCLADTDCTSPAMCMAGPISGAYGYCLTPCTLFGSDCPAGTKCKLARTEGPAGPVGTCFFPGTQALGWGCDYDTECQDDLVCWMGACTAFCDSSHPCPVLQPVAPTCQAFQPPSPNGAGLCMFTTST